MNHFDNIYKTVLPNLLILTVLSDSLAMNGSLQKIIQITCRSTTNYMVSVELPCHCCNHQVAMRALGFDVKKTDVLKVLRDYDREGTGKITFEDFNEVSTYNMI